MTIRRVIPLWTILGLLVVLPPSVGADEPLDAVGEAARQQRLAFMGRTFGEFELSTEGADQPCRHGDKALLRYSNPVRNFFSDGATYLWLNGKRPVAAATISIRGTGKVWWEFTSLSERPLRCVHEGRAVWTPKSGNLIGQPLPDAPDPAPTPQLRLLQMRRAARRFTVVMQESETRSDEVQALRLLPKPIHRWSDAEAGVVEGAMFAFCETTDPEALLVLELIQPDRSAPAWQYSLARMTSRPLVFRLDEREVASLKGYWANPRSPEDPYAGALLGTYQRPTDPGTE